MAKRIASLNIENVGDSQYLQDHHNRVGEALLYCWFPSNSSLASIESTVRNEFAACDNIPSRVCLPASEVSDCARAIREELLIAAADRCESLEIQLLVTWN
jgi:hypothetical protein